MTRIVRFFMHSLFLFILVAVTAWATTALWLNLENGFRYLALCVAAFAFIGTGVARLYKRRLGWLALVMSAGCVFAWYQTLTPSDDRTWATDVSRGVTAQVDGTQVTLQNLRDFDWQTRDIAAQSWVSGTYDLDQLESVEMLTSVWDSPDIAHLLVSFGFANDEQVVFSVEIRREQGEKFSEVGGFFRQFELVLIGATEQDIVRLRTDVRKESVRMFDVDLTPEQRRTMFMSYVNLARDLEEKPQFYNTISANCTTVVYGLARNLKSDLPIRISLILSGRLPEYLEELGVLGGEGSMQDRHDAALLSENAQRMHPDLTYSQAIRAR